jgi:hypothetical protein
MSGSVDERGLGVEGDAGGVVVGGGVVGYRGRHHGGCKLYLAKQNFKGCPKKVGKNEKPKKERGCVKQFKN